MGLLYDFIVPSAQPVCRKKSLTSNDSIGVALFLSAGSTSARK